ncbi:MAG: hypothetical protein ACON4U_10930 [Myxococcota bacterium]
MLLAAAFVHSALGNEPNILHAQYEPDGHQIKGTLTSNETAWLTPLNSLTVPNVQWLVERSFPFEINHGQITLSENTEILGFDTKLPQRWDLAGWDHSGLYMNGLWHPQFTEYREELWTVQINVPDDYWVVLNGQISKGDTTWTGQAHVHDLTILPNIEVYDTGQHIIVSAHSAVNQAERLEFCLSKSYPKTTVVVAPMHHRLAVAGQDQVWLSAHALEGDLELWKTHCDTVDRTFQAVHSPENTHWKRQLDGYIRTQPALKLEPQLETFKWLPQIDFLLYSGRLPYQSDIFNREPLYLVPNWADAYPQQYPLTNVYHHLMRTLTIEELQRLKEETIPLEPQLRSMNIPEKQLEIWQSEPKMHNFFIRRKDRRPWLFYEGDQVTPFHFPIKVRIDGIEHDIQVDHLEKGVMLPNGDSYWIDPDETFYQTNRMDDQYPTKWHITGLIFPYSISTDNWYPSISGNLSARPHAKHPFRIVSAMNTSPTILLNIEQYVIYGWGPLLDSRVRPLNTWLSGGVQFPDDFQKPVQTIEIGSSYNNRSSWLFPREGIGSQVAVGRSQSAEQTWMTSRASWTGIRNLSHRLVMAQRISGTYTGSNEYDTQIPIGGLKAVAGRSVEADRGQFRAISNSEMRILLMRGRHYNLPLIRWTDLIAHIGWDLGYLDALENQTANGLFTGLSFAGDGLHVLPGYFGISMGWSPEHQPQYYVHIAHRL